MVTEQLVMKGNAHLQSILDVFLFVPGFVDVNNYLKTRTSS